MYVVVDVVTYVVVVISFLGNATLPTATPTIAARTIDRINIDFVRGEVMKHTIQ